MIDQNKSLMSPKKTNLMQRNLRMRQGRTQVRAPIDRSSSPPLRAQSLNKKQQFQYRLMNPQIKLFDITIATESEQAKYIFWIKDKLKLYKVMFKKYAVGSQSRKNETFDDVKDNRHTMTLAAVNTFLSDCYLIKKMKGKMASE